MSKTAADMVKELFLSESELANILGVDSKRIRDLRSNHTQGKEPFIPYIKPTARCVLFKLADVLAYLHDQKLYSFGIGNYSDESETD